MTDSEVEINRVARALSQHLGETQPKTIDLPTIARIAIDALRSNTGYWSTTSHTVTRESYRDEAKAFGKCVNCGHSYSDHDAVRVRDAAGFAYCPTATKYLLERRIRADGGGRRKALEMAKH